jgi:hypothetical protein
VLILAEKKKEDEKRLEVGGQRSEDEVEENSASKEGRKLSFLSREQVAKTRNQCCHLENHIDYGVVT